ncbi:porin [Vibrio marisflavi]|uniref:Porin domain-containing protein n=1 Tax=Vibrio marisflavi CECT 7928 TaxID=634439 RepID=A0ABM9A6M6_9VIBR|nr:porin [Vibrio marisflavi]CAH0540620.1 hypothetical protein VMF7928_02986 [Vibrio marisflavi CECT 7928]
MKKTLIALAVLATAGSVNAAQIYGSDTSKVSLKGEIDSYISNWDSDATSTKYDTDVDVWAKIQIDAEHQLNDMFTAFGSFEIEQGNGWKPADNEANGAVFDDLYVGVKTDKWGVVLGEHGDWADSLDAIEKDDITNEGYYLSDSGGHHRESKGHGVGFKATVVDGLTFVADVTTEQTDGLSNTYGASLNYDISNYSVGVAYQSGEATGGTTYNPDYYKGGISASATFGGLFVAATYSAYEGVNSNFGFFDDAVTSGTYYEGNAYGVAVSYTVDSWKPYVTYGVMSNDKSYNSSTNTKSDVNNADVDNLLVGLQYTISDNLLTFIEYQTGSADAGFTGSTDQDGDSWVWGTYYTF